MRRIGWGAGLALAVGMALGVPAAFAASTITMTFVGKPGPLGGAVKLTAVKEVPMAASETERNTAAGRGKHHSITVTREVDSASPLIYQALATNGIFPQVIFQISMSSNGKSEAAEKIVLEKAVVTSIKQVTGGAKPSEEITLTYETLQATTVSGKTSPTYDWGTAEAVAR